jgi:hypothetical protein
MANEPEINEKTLYHLRVKGILDEKWTDWFDGFVMTSRNDGETLLSGQAPDQAALHGVLDKIHSLGLPLLLVLQTECPCNSKNCSLRGQCQECLANHAASGKLPFCFRERTHWDKQVSKIR